MGAKKPRIVLQLLEEREFDGIVLSDTDVVWMKRPHELLARHKAADVLILTDCLSLQVIYKLYESSPFLHQTN